MGAEPGTAAIRVRGETNDLVFTNNQIRDTRDPKHQTQTVGILLETQVGLVDLDENEILANKPIEDQRGANHP